MNKKKIIKEILAKFGKGQINLESESARDMVADKIIFALTKNVKIIIGNIEDQDTQVIVNPTNAELAWEDLTVNGAIHREAGVYFTKACEDYMSWCGPLQTNESVFLNGYNANAEQILNIYPPFWQTADTDEENIEKLYDCYVECFNECIENKLTKSISFPLIGAGTFMYPIQASYQILANVIDDMDVSMFGEIRIVFWKEEQYNKCKKLFKI